MVIQVGCFLLMKGRGFTIDEGECYHCGGRGERLSLNKGGVFLVDGGEWVYYCCKGVGRLLIEGRVRAVD